MNNCVVCDLDAGSGHFHMSSEDILAVCVECYNSGLFQTWLREEMEVALQMSGAIRNSDGTYQRLSPQRTGH